MSAVSIGLLVAGAALMLVRPRGIPTWAGPVGAAAVALAVSAVSWDAAGDALRTMRDPLLFLVFAVPLASTLDRIGVFEALAALVDGGRHVAAWLWVLAAAVTIVFNLDAAVVLLTPLYIRIARRHGLPAEALAFQPALIACLASNPLPVSNLTNLLVAERFQLGSADFVRHLALPTAVAVVVGWWGYRRSVLVPGDSQRAGRAMGTDPGSDAGADPRHGASVDVGALVRGVPVVVFVLLGFTVGDALGVAAWMVAATALVLSVLIVGTDRGVRRAGDDRGADHSPVREVADSPGRPGFAGRVDVARVMRAVPFEAMAIAAGLSVLVAGATPSLGLDRVLAGEGAWGRLQALAVGAAGADLTNNLPAVLAAMPALGTRDQVWPLLLGVNLGPVFVITGALSSLLWRDTAAKLDVVVSARRFAAVGLRVGGPAFVAAGLVVVLAP